MTSIRDVRKYYRQVVLLLFCLLILFMTWMRLRELDYLAVHVADSGYVEDRTARNGDRILAEACEQIYMYPGSFRLAIRTAAPDERAYIQVYDKWRNDVIAQQPYDPNEEVQNVYFTTDKIQIDVVVRTLTADPSLQGEDLGIKEYFIISDERVCTDANWFVALLALLMILFYLGYRRMVRLRRPAFWLLTAAAALTALPFYSIGLQDGHDMGFHLTRIANIGLAMVEGYYPERLNLLSGGGTIIPIMYPEVFLAGAGFMVSTGATVMLAYKVLCTGITFATAYVAYYSARQITEEQTALIFAVLWLINPFRMNELLIRAAIGEALAVTFLPLIALGMWQVFQDSCRKGMMHLVLGYTGLLACHVLTTVIAAVFCALFVLAWLVMHPVRFVRELYRVGWLVLAAGLTVLANMYFLIPFLSFYGWDLFLTNAENTASTVQDSAAPLWQLFMGAIGQGWNSQTSQMKGEMPQSAGPVLLLTAVAWVFYAVWRSERSNGEGHDDGKMQQAAWYAWILGIWGVYMSSIYFPWEMLTRYSEIFAKVCGSVQYAWRFMMIPACLLSFVLAVFVCQLIKDRAPICRHLAMGCLVIAGISAILTMTKYYSQNDLKLADHFDNMIDFNADYVRTDVYGRYVELKDQLAENYVGVQIDGDAQGVSVEDYHAGNEYVLTVTNKSDHDAVVTIPLFWYGQHRAVMTTEMGETELLCVENAANQFTDVTVPSGVDHATIRLVYQEPANYKVGYLISGITVVVLAAGTILFNRKTRMQ